MQFETEELPMFIGCGRTNLIYSRQAYRVLSMKEMSREPDLMLRKWWDYRVRREEDGDYSALHPMEATYLFAHYYIQAFERAVERRSGLEYHRPLKNPDFTKCAKSTITGMWRARRMADSHGIPYDFWCREAMNFAEIFDFKHLPRPTHLYSRIDNYAWKREKPLSIVDFIVGRWEEFSAQRFVHAKGSFYTHTEFQGHRYQISHMQKMMRVLRNSHQKAVTASSLVYTYGVLDPRLVIMEMGEEEGQSLLERAKYLAE